MPLSRKPLSKAEKSLIAVCCLIVLPAAGIVYLYGGRDAEPKWNIPPAPAPPSPNGYDFYVAAAKATVRFTPEVDPASDSTRTPHDPGTPYALKNYSLARRQQWLTANAHTFALINQGLTTPSMAPDFATKPMGDWATLRQLARDMSVRTRTFQMEGQPMKATMSALDGIQMSQDTTRGGGLMARLVGIAMVAIERDPLEDWNKTINALNASEARTAARRLESLLSHQSTTDQFLMADKRDTLVDLQRIFMFPGWRSTLLPASSEEKPSPSQIWQTQTTSKQTIYNNMNRVLDARIANARLPYSKALSSRLPKDVDVFTQYLVGTGNRTIALEARDATSNNMLLLRLALRAYIAEHGTAPPTLPALVSGYLKSIPIDIYNDGKPLFYTAQGQTYKLWSVGPDMINNGGVPFPARNPKSKFPATNTLDNKGDFVAGLCK